MKCLIVWCAVISLFSNVALPCTTLFINKSPSSIVAKNMDWPSGQGMVLVNKRHVQKRAVFVTPENALQWTSKFASLTFTQSGREFPWEGMNEVGLSVTVMFLGQSMIPGTADSHKSVNGLQWIQFILDTSASVTEAIQNAKSVKLEGSMATREHFLVCDSHASCASFEYIKGQLVIHDGARLSYKALTNNIYDDSVEYLNKVLASEQPEVILSHRTIGSLDRFARAALLSSRYSPQMNELDFAFSALENVLEPEGTSWPTQWSFVFSLAKRTVHFKTLQSKGIKEVRLGGFNPSCKSPVMMFNMNAVIAGDVTAAFVPYQDDTNRRLVEMSKNIMPVAKPVIENYVGLNTRCTE